MPLKPIYRGALFHAEYNFKLGNLEIMPYVDHNITFLELRIEGNVDYGVFPNDTYPNIKIAAYPDKKFGVREFGSQKFENPWADCFRTRGGALARYNFLSHHTLFAGAEYEFRHNGEYQMQDKDGKKYTVDSTTRRVLDPAIDPAKALRDSYAQPAGAVYEISIFGHYELNWNKFMLLLGGRYVNNELAGNKVVPRGSLIYHLTDDSSLKFLYAEAYNSPNLHQFYADLPNVVGNKKLKAESVRTMDFAFTKVMENQIFVANLYHLKTDNLILRMPNPDPKDQRKINMNVPGFERFGAELDYQLFWRKLKVLTGVGYHHQGNQLGAYFDFQKAQWEDNTRRIQPKWTWTLGASYKITPHHAVGLSNLLLSERFSTTLEKSRESVKGRDATNENNIETLVEKSIRPNRLDVQDLLILNYTFTWNNLRAFLDLYNVLNQRLENPDYGLRIPSIENGPGFSAYAGVSYDFNI
jgi:outer membrane receptor protein involved in Fe transport